ncbi:uncharacterized methyltransferase At1g78140, chloroplastic-like [Primulina eburnea]|uniref:uncharacterized methyltransferase At1g78140, chloroplastic-like n=1 Tax=Primulina eburnea TaxID=1245227 RepID=UPI003C6C1D76
MDEAKLNLRDKILSCPICYEPVIWNSQPGLSLESLAHCSLRCRRCRKSYSGNESHIHLTVTGGNKVYGESMAASTELFRFPLVSFLYERGWRQSFSILRGFPGPAKEFELIKSYLKPVLGGNIIDASCGSGMFSRLFAKSGLFSLVVGLDFSETMLKECYGFSKQEDKFPDENLILVRSAISRLPFASHTVDAVHVGAALHCWPSQSAAVAEISRVSRPGGIFVATTYILDGLLSYAPLRRPIREACLLDVIYILMELSKCFYLKFTIFLFRAHFFATADPHAFLSEKELEDLCTRNRRFVMISALKPVVEL